MNNYSAKHHAKHWLRILAILMVVLLVIGGVGAFAARRVYYQNISAASTSTEEKTIIVTEGETAHDIALKLNAAGIIRSVWAFEWFIRSHDARDKLQAGAYSLSPSQSVESIVAMLTSGKVSANLLTILPAQRLDQIKQAFAKSGFTSAQIDAAFDPAQYASHPVLADKPATANLEGYLYPDSYEKTANTAPETIIRQSLDEMNKHLLPQIKSGFKTQGLSLHQGITLASIVEEEVSNPTDRPIVAQVFMKRLKSNISLGSDVTAFYGAIIAGQEPSVTYDTPYNTRIHTGLPAGPINNVSENSLLAVAEPANTDYLFFVAGDDGVTYFSKTLQEHEAATAKYCKELCN